MVRDCLILRHLYTRSFKGPESQNGQGLKITELRQALKPQGLKQQEVASNLDYLVQKGWVREVVEIRTFTTPRGTTQQAEKRTYKISDSGIDRLEAASLYKAAPAGTHINISNIHGVTVVREGNVVNATFTDLSRVLSDAKAAIVAEPQLSDSQKLEAIADIDSLQSQLQKPDPDKSVIQKLWSGVEKVAAVGVPLSSCIAPPNSFGPCCDSDVVILRAAVSARSDVGRVSHIGEMVVRFLEEWRWAMQRPRSLFLAAPCKLKVRRNS